MEAAAACRPGTEARPESGEDDGASLPRTAHGGGTTELLTLTGQLLDADQRLCAGETRRPARAAAAGRSPSRSGAERGRRGDSGSGPGGGRGGLRREIRKAARRPWRQPWSRLASSIPWSLKDPGHNLIFVSHLFNFSA
jgi:hypothetical protein